MREQIRKYIIEALSGAKYEDVSHIDFSVSVPEIPEYGDYSSNIAFKRERKIASVFGDKHVGEILDENLEARNPRKQAEKYQLILLDDSRSNSLARPEVAGSGFLNFFLADAFLIEQLEEVLKNPEQWGRSTVGKEKTFVLDYFQLNVAKRPHVGHLRSAVIGDAVKRMLLSFGYTAVSDTHVGDWGTQFGILLLGYKELVKKGEEQSIVENPFEGLEQLYIEENKRIEEDPSRREHAKLEFAKLEQGDAENRKLWEWMVDVSMQKLHENSYALGLLEFEEHRGESFYEDKMPPIVEAALEQGVAKKLEDGAVVVDLEEEGLDQAVLIKSDGASTYLLRDLATTRYRKERWQFTQNLYFVDVRQSHHFRQVFRVAERLGFEGVGESIHVSYGHMSLPEGPISTRKGQVIWLEKLFDEAIAKAKAVIAEKNPELANADEVARMVGMGAIKYFDLSHHRNSDIVFRWEEVLSFEGNTGPYLQYTYARLKSILRKAGGKSSEIQKNVHMDSVEHRLAAAILRLPEAIEDALKEYTPNTLANYLFGLAQLTNEFYHSHPVMQETDEEKRDLRIALVEAAALTLRKGLYLLGIEAPEEM